MGAWGNSPEDNDTAGDQFDVVIGPTLKKLDQLFAKRTDTDGRWTRLGVLSMLLRSSAVADRIDTITTDVAVNDIDDIRADTPWLSSWKDPAGVRRQLTALMKRIEETEPRVRWREEAAARTKKAKARRRRR